MGKKVAFSVLLLALATLGWSTAAAVGATGIKMKFDMRIPMRDGVELSADVWLPAQPGKYPAILMRNPYLKTRWPDLGEFYAKKGYVLVMQDTRGRGDSGGEFDFMAPESKDGYDSVEWVAAQPWCNGRVGMIGNSYLANVQWYAAREAPPHLVCIIPAATGGRWFNSRPYHAGAFLGSWALDWLNLTSARIIQQPNASAVDWEQVFWHRPLLDMDEFMGRRMRLWKEWVEHDTYDEYWKRIELSPADFKKIRVAALHLSGWFDHLLPGSLAYWEGMRAHAPENDKQYMVLGPWNHGQTFRGGGLRIGDMEFGGNSVLDQRALHLAFLDHFLKGAPSRFDSAHVRIYLTGENRWLEGKEYPPVPTQVRRLYLHSGGRANTLAGDGRLTWDPPGSEPADRYTFNPKNPVPSEIGGQYLGMDQQAMERRDDVLVYSTEALKEPLPVVGRVFVNVYAATDGRDTDFTAKLVDVHPDGRAIHLGSLPVGILRGRYRKSFERQELLAPNKTEQFRIELTDIAHTFLAGHRLRVEISSSAYPYVFPNSNTGNRPAIDTEWRVARQTVSHDGACPSHLELPVLANP